MDIREIGQLLVDETAETLNCRRVSLLVLDEKRQNLKLVASCGLPESVRNLVIPVGQTIAGQVLTSEDLLIVNDTQSCERLTDMSQGTYESESFATVRLPLRAGGQAIGVLNVTERDGDPAFAARDRKLLEAFSAMGASALLNARLHGAISRQMMSTIRALASAVDAKDRYTHNHSARVAHLALATAEQLGTDGDVTQSQVELAGVLHDVGKIGITDSILGKSEQLTAAEFAVIRTHTEIGARIVGHVEGLEPVARAILCHHERFDGLGYPCGLAATDIPLAARIIAVGDVYDTLVSDRPYRKAVSSAEAVAEICRCRGRTSIRPSWMRSWP